MFSEDTSLGEDRGHSGPISEVETSAVKILLTRRTESSLSDRERSKICANWQEFAAYTSPPGVLFSWDESQLPEDLLHYCRHHGLVTPVGCEKWETSEDLWMFLVMNAASDEVIGSYAVGQTRLVNDRVEDSDPRKVSDAKSSKSHTEQQTRLTGDSGEGCVLMSEKDLIAVEQSKSAIQSEQQETTVSVQTTLETFQHTLLGPNERDTCPLTTPEAACYSRAVSQYDSTC
jgi:hypothetical protein